MADVVELRAAWTRHVGNGPSELAVLDDVVARHREPQRRYHGVHHVTWVIRHVHDLAAEVAVRDLGAIIVAAFFHDAVYDPRASDNEACSARVAARALTGLGWDGGRTLAVTAMIQATAKHEWSADGDTAVLLDADLAVLGAEPSPYVAYVTGVRAEYAHLDAASWRDGRRHVLERLLSADPLFATEPGRRRWAARARANLTAELATLAAPT